VNFLLTFSDLEAVLMKLALVVKKGPHRGAVIPVGRAQFLIGRDQQCQLRPLSREVSAFHCSILLRNGKCYVRDLNSARGTFVNARQLMGELELGNEDSLQVGPLSFVVRIDDRTAQPGSAPPLPNPQAASETLSLRAGATSIGTVVDDVIVSAAPRPEQTAPDSEPAEEKPAVPSRLECPVCGGLVKPPAGSGPGKPVKCALCTASFRVPAGYTAEPAAKPPVDALTVPDEEMRPADAPPPDQATVPDHALIPVDEMTSQETSPEQALTVLAGEPVNEEVVNEAVFSILLEEREEAELPVEQPEPDPIVPVSAPKASLPEAAASARLILNQYRSRRLQSSGSQGRSGFSLIELLVVIAIIGVLVGLVLTAVQKAREAANRIACVNNLKQNALAVHLFHDANNRFPPSAVWDYDATGTTGTQTYVRRSIWVYLLPFVEQQNISDQYDWNVQWSKQPNLQLMANRIRVYECPSAQNPRTVTSGGVAMHTADYAPVSGVSSQLANAGILQQNHGGSQLEIQGGNIIEFPGFFDNILHEGDPTTSVISITDGLSNTIMLAECGGRNSLYENGVLNTTAVLADADNPDSSTLGAGACTGGPWGQPRNQLIIFGWNSQSRSLIGPTMINGTNSGEVYSFHPNLANFAYGDGSVRPILATIDPDTFVSLVTRHGGEAVSPP
jgi:prepilin-type N-terminal cleavage/methylation domain-containing protein/prepilin-type processing-associated H-X9-DG protein